MNAKVNFTIKSLTEVSEKIVAEVKFDNYDKIYTYRHKAYEDGKGRYTLINGFAVYFNDKYEVTDIEFRYHVKSAKKRAGKEGASEKNYSAQPIPPRPEKEKDADTDDESAEKSVFEQIKEEAEKHGEKLPYIPKEVVKHKEFDTIKTCIENDLPIYLAGPAGSGKNHTVEQVAKELGLDFYFTNSVQQEYKLTGFIDAGGVYHETEFYRAFTKGGIFFLDEMDASIPEVLVLLNAAIANRYFEFPIGKVTAHENFRVVAAGNTVGSGSDEAYTGRMVLDQATLDRFVIIEFNYDYDIEMHLAHGNEELVDFIENIRTVAENQMLRTTFSYRCISMVQKLEAAGMPLDKIMIIAVVKGLPKDTINLLANNVTNDNKYSQSLRKANKKLMSA